MKDESFDHVRVVLCQNEIPITVTKEAFKKGRIVGALTYWNPAPVPTDNCSDVLPLVDVLCVNETEAQAVSGLTDLDAALQALVQKVPSVVVTMGKRGCMLLQKGRDIVRIPAAPADKVVDTTGAGDCFCGTMAWCLSRGISLYDAAKIGNQVAAISVTRYGAQASYPTLSECPAEVQRTLA